MATHDLNSGLEVKTLSLRADVDGQPVAIPNAHFLFTAEFERSGHDLVMSHENGQTIIIDDYFAGTTQADLAAPNGALLRASVVESLAGPLAPGQYAQAGTPAGKAPIGQVETLEGEASVQRTDGTKVTLKIGDPVFQGDVVSTAGSSKVGITFIDQTVFTLSEDARMVLDELVYSPGGSDNSMLVNLVQGTFVFIAGEVAPSGDMKVQTPVATMGIRGTTVISKISATDGTLSTSLDADPDGKTGSYEIIDTATNKVLAVVTETDQNWIITAPGAPGEPPTVTTLPRTTADFQLDQPALAFVYQTYNAARARFGQDSNSDNNDGNNDGGPNSVPGSGIDSGVDGNEFTPLNGTGTPGNPNNGAPPPSPDEDPSGPPQGLPGGSNDQSQGITPGSEGTLVTTDEDTPSGGINIPVTPPESEDQIDITIVELPAMGLLLFQGVPVTEGETIAATSTDDLTFSPNGEFEELNSTDVAPLQFLYTVSIGSNVSAPVVGVISVPGVNDDPEAEEDSTEGFENEVLTIDVLDNDTDVDRDDNPTNFTLLSAAIVSETGGGTVAVVANQLEFDPGTDFDYLNVGDSAEVLVEYTMTDDEGAQSTADVLITVTGQNDAPVAESDSTEGFENEVLTIDVLNNDTDVDSDDNPTNFTLLSAAIVSETAGGTVAVVANQLEFDPGTDFDFLNSGDSAEIVVEYTMTDDEGTQSTAEVVITVTGQNDGPVAEEDSTEGFENEVLTIDVLANDTDVDRDDNPTNFTLLSAAIVSETGGGTVAVVANQLQFNPGTDFDFLNVGDSEEVVVEYTMSDDEGAQSTAEAVITVTGQNDAPMALANTLETTVDTPGSGQLGVIDPDDNETAAFAPGSNGPQHGTVVIQPDGAFTYTPTPVLEGPPFVGFDEFEFTVTDAAGATSTGTVTVEVDNAVFDPGGDQEISFGINGEAPLTSDEPLRDGIGIGNVEVDLSEVSGTPINVSFVFDSSGSLNGTEYGLQMAAIQTAIDDLRVQFQNSVTGVEVQMVQFASAITKQGTFDLYDEALDDVAGEFPSLGGGTNFDTALLAAQTFFASPSQAGQPGFLFFTSDGQPFGSGATPYQTTAAALTSAGIVIAAFGIGTGATLATLNQIDNTGPNQTGDAQIVSNPPTDLAEAFAGSPLFTAKIADLSLSLVADGQNQGEVATEDDLVADGINLDLLLADIPNIGDLLGEVNQFTATAVIDFDNDLLTTDDQITLVSVDSINASDTEVTKTGTSGDDLLLGGVLDDEIDGAGGDDVILGFAGDDELKGDGAVFLDGGADNDKLEVTDDTFKKVDGGTGQDTLVLDNTDLNFNDLDSSQFSSIEAIDLKEAGANTLTLTFDGVLDLSETGNDQLDAILDGLLGAANAPDDSLVVDGGSTDTVVLEGDASGAWTLFNQTAFAGYDIYAFQDLGGSTLAAVAIDDDVAVAFPPE